MHNPLPFVTNDTPAAFVRKLWYARQLEPALPERSGDMTEEGFVSIALPLAVAHHAAIFDKTRPGADVEAAYLFFIQLHEAFEDWPAAWFGMFRRAFAEGMLSAAAWGVAARMTYLNGGRCRFSKGERHSEHLEGLRTACRNGLMLRDERARYETLPQVVKVYRGSLAPSVDAAALGISWSLSQHYASIHLTRRNLQARNELFGGDAGSARTLGRPILVEASVPKSAVFAYFGVGDEEVLVDCDHVYWARELPHSTSWLSMLASVSRHRGWSTPAAAAHLGAA